MTDRARTLGVYTALVAIAALAGLLLGRCSARAQPGGLQPDTVWVPRTVIERGKPDTVVKFTERIVYRPVKPAAVQVAPGAAADPVDAFVRAATDTIIRTDTVLVMRPTPRMIDAMKYNEPRLDVWLVGADRAASREIFQGVRGDFEVNVDVASGTVHVQHDRWARVKSAGVNLAFFTAGLVIGNLGR